MAQLRRWRSRRQPLRRLQPYAARTLLGVTAAYGKVMLMSSNIKVFGYVVSAESCVSDPQRKLIV